MLGPMVNPAFPKNQVVGVFSLELARMYAYLYQKTDKNFTILHALDGYDEISLTGNTKMITNNAEAMLRPADLNLQAIKASEISGGDSIGSAAEIFVNVLDNKGTAAQENVVCANAAVAIDTVKKTGLENAFLEAKESLRSGRALTALKKLQQLN